MSFSHPPELRQLFQQQSLAPKQAALSALGYAIKKGDEAGVREALKQAKAEGEGWLLNEFDYAGYTPLVGLSPVPSFFSLSLRISHTYSPQADTRILTLSTAGSISRLRHLHPPFSGTSSPKVHLCIFETMMAIHHSTSLQMQVLLTM